MSEGRSKKDLVGLCQRGYGDSACPMRMFTIGSLETENQVETG